MKYGLERWILEWIDEGFHFIGVVFFKLKFFAIEFFECEDVVLTVNALLIKIKLNELSENGIAVELFIIVLEYEHIEL